MDAFLQAAALVFTPTSLIYMFLMEMDTFIQEIWE